MNIDPNLIKKIASVSRLNLTDKETEKFTSDLQNILDAFKKLDEVDVSNIPTAIHPIDVKNITRDDIPKKCLSNEEALENTTLKKDGFFKGPRSV
ncbi:Asp-tRNA(Asn)/Glu-tRNA(Gln) amidotransferase subunit GatC [Candidatus Woesearchaeota archaeon]|jgi:aspartyl-tRNA(Asn)/glutamyl-tRNA(Gln) amidotransferase subunit C|nr:Asp-tRNA(Asn)/Glu-tRNA(Gln) amidotransferase subunit GatC [Candidatus Woesearchaeota archaeon]MBT7368910.1 Asp-tRNA(Asn)/Glu-tRNA(Gln) amidotransferase subunit GatC [Candidatus Woesearchaeota archaeon]